MNYISTSEAFNLFRRKPDLKKLFLEVIKNPDIAKYILKTDVDNNSINIKLNLELSTLLKDIFKENFLLEIKIESQTISSEISVELKDFDLFISKNIQNAIGDENLVIKSLLGPFGTFQREKNQLKFGLNPFSNLSKSRDKKQFIHDTISMMINKVENKLNDIEEALIKMMEKSQERFVRIQSSLKNQQEINLHNQEYLTQFKKIVNIKDELTDYFYELEDLAKSFKYTERRNFLDFSFDFEKFDLKLDDEFLKIISILKTAKKRIQENYPDILIDIDISKNNIDVTFVPKNIKYIKMPFPR